MEPIYSPTVERLYNSLPEVMRLADARYDYALKNYISSTGDILGDIEEIMARVEYLSANDRLGIEQEYEHTDWIPKTEYFWDGERNKSTSRAVSEDGDVVVNLATNPSFKDTNGTVEVYRNLATNPSFENSGGTLEVRRNLASNPSFETTDGTAEVYRNRFPNPAAQGVPGQIPLGFTGWAGTGNTNAIQPGDGDGFLLNGSCRAVWNTVTTPSSGDIGITISAGVAALNEGDIFTVAFNRRASRTGMRSATLSSYAATGTILELVARNRESGLLMDAGEIYHEWITFKVLPHTQVPNDLRINSNVGPIAVGDYFETGDVDFYVGPYQPSRKPFSGSYSPDPDLTPSWTGAVNNSISIVTGARVARTVFSGTSCVGVQSSQWGKDGGTSVRLVPKGTTNDTSVSVAETSGTPTGTGITLTPGKTYTALGTLRLDKPQTGDLNGHARTLQWVSNNISGWSGAVGVKSSAAPNEPGEYDLRVTFTVPLDTVWCLLRIYNGASAGNGDVWWDNLAIVEGEYSGPYFDGNISPDPNLTPSWTGAANNSPSVLTATGTTFEAYQNLATNPSFEAAGSTVEVWRNQALNPRAVLGGSSYGWSSNSGTGSWETGSGLPSPLPDTFRRVVATATGAVGFYGLLGVGNYAGGEVVTFSRLVRLSGGGDVRLGLEGAAFAANSYQTYVTIPADEWTLISWTFTVPPVVNPAGGQNIICYATGISIGDAVDQTAMGIGLNPEYSDGTFSPDSDLTPSWTGTVNNSPSVLTGTRASGFFDAPQQRVAICSQQWAVGGGSSLRVIRTGGTPSQAGAGGTLAVSELPDGVYTALVWCHIPEGYDASEDGYSNRAIYLLGDTGNYTQSPSESGTYLLRHVFTKSGSTSLRLGGGGADGQSVYWDNLAIIEGEYSGPYFDGDTSPDPDLIPSWTGAVNASRSLLTGTRASGTWVGWQSKQWAATGDFSHYIPQGSVQEYVIDAGKSFQIQPREVGQPYLVNGDPRTTTGQPINIIGPAMIETGQGWWDNLAIVEGKYTGPYFDGNTSSDPDLMPSWEGSVNNSTSILSGRKLGWVTNVDAINHRVYQSEVDGSNWLRITPIGTSSDTSAGVYGSASSLLMLPGKTYTALAKLRLDAPQTGTLNNVARSIVFASNSVAGWGGVTYASVKGENRTGVQELRLTFTVPADAVWSYIRLYNGASVGGGDVWWDNLMITEGPYIGPYFDGDTTPAYEVSPVDHKTSDLIDGRFADAKWLPWISQILGVQTGNITSDTDLRRRLVNSTAGLYAGTEESILGAVKAVLSGGKNAVLRRGRTKTGAGSVWDILLITVDSETPIDFDFHSYLTRQGVKPAGVIIHQSTYAPTWETLNTERPIWEDWDDDTWQMIMETGI